MDPIHSVSIATVEPNQVTFCVGPDTGGTITSPTGRRQASKSNRRIRGAAKADHSTKRN